MTPPDWPDLWNLIRLRLELKGRGTPDRDGWVWARCINPKGHKNGDQNPSLRINVQTGGVKCMSQDCDIGTNMNDLAERLGVEIHGDTKRTGTIADLAGARKLDGNALIELWGVSCTAKGWQLTIDDPDAAGFRRLKRYPWANGPKYLWEPKGVKASDLVYGITRLDTDAKDAFIACGEPDTWVCVAADLSAVSFLAGENTVPSPKAIAKLKARAPNLKTLHIAPDLDDAGRRGAHKVGAALLAAGLAVELIHLPDDLPEGGDLSDLWVSCDGDREAFLRRLYGCETEWLKAEGPRIERRGDDAYSIWLPTEGGWTRFDFDQVTGNARALEAEMSVAVELPGYVAEPYVASTNIMSVSGKDALKRQLTDLYPELAWPQLLNSAFSHLRQEYFGADPSVDLSTIEPRSQEGRYRVGSLLPKGQPTIFFGDGSTGKTYLALVLALAVATGDELLGLPVIFDRVLVIDYETDAQTYRFRYDRLLAGFGLSWQPRLIDYWPAKGRPLADIADAVRRKVERDRNGLIIVDSAAYACGGDPKDAEVALRYFNALNSIGKTSLTIAHVPKDSDQDKPFGSVYWSNSARKTWNFQRAQDEGEDVIHIGLFNKKVNDGRRDKPIGLRMTFEGETGPVTVKREDVADVPELAKGLSVRQRLLACLKRAAMTVEDMAEEVGEDPKVIRARLSEMKAKGEVQHVNSSDGSDMPCWGLVERRHE